MNHRMGKRVESTHSVTLDVAGLGRFDGRLRDLSLSGAAVDCKEAYLLDRYMPVTIHLQMDDGLDPDRISVVGFITRMDASLIGIMFMQEMVDLLTRVRLEQESPNPA